MGMRVKSSAYCSRAGESAVEDELVLFAVFPDPVDDAGEIVARAGPVHVEMRLAAGEADARFPRLLRADAVEDDRLVVEVEEIPRQIVRDYAEFVAREPEFAAVIIRERVACDRDGVASCHEVGDRIHAFLENMAVAVVDRDVFLDEDVVDLIDDREMILVFRREQDVAEPGEIADGTGTLQAERRQDREDGVVVEEQTRIAEERLVVDLGKQLGDEENAVVGTSADVDVRGSENMRPVRIQPDRCAGFPDGSCQARRDSQFLLFELKHVEL